MVNINRAVEIYSDEGLFSLGRSVANYLALAFRRIVIGRPLATVYRLKPIDRYAYEVSIERLNRLQDSERDLQDVLATAYEYTGLGFYQNISPIQHPDELQKVTKECREIDPDVVVEIGTDRGGTLYTWSRGANASTAISVDRNFSHISGSPLRYQNRTSFMREFDQDTQFHFVEGDSQKEKTAHLVQESLDGQDIDFLFIDADHSYEGVSRDFELYSQFVSEGGIIALHDVKNPNTGIPEFWNKLKEEHDTKTIHSNKEFRSLPHIETERHDRVRKHGGIGLVYL